VNQIDLCGICLRVLPSHTKCAHLPTHLPYRYIGGRSEDVGSRSRLGWDMAFGGGGLVVSGGFFATFDDALSRCYDAAPWSAVGSDEVSDGSHVSVWGLALLGNISE